MAIEIERKFLVAGDGWRRAVMLSTPMRQGYLGDSGGGVAGRSSVRVRLAGEAAWINVKAAVTGAARAEYEYAIPPADAREMLDGLCAGVLDKTRHQLPAGTGPDDGRIWEIDEFHGRNAGLLVAEIELAHIEQSFLMPEWLGDEVTALRRYYNHALVTPLIPTGPPPNAARRILSEGVRNACHTGTEPLPFPPPASPSICPAPSAP